jgi:hypothetical protein
MLRHVTTAPPILVNRSQFNDLVALARRTAEDRSRGFELADAVLALEAERHRLEWDDADTTVPVGRYVGDERGFFRWLEVPPEARNNPGQPVLRELWRGGNEEITVVDQPPIPAERMARLESLGIASPESWRHLAEAPFSFFYVGDPRWGRIFYMADPSWSRIRAPSLAVVEKAAGPPGGAWIVAGVNREPVAWVGSDMDAAYMACAVNMALELEMDVARGSCGSYDFPARICGSGIVGLIRMLRRSIEPEERWEPEPSDALRAAGAELEKRVVEFMAEVCPHRVNQSDKDRRGQP